MNYQQPLLKGNMLKEIVRMMDGCPLKITIVCYRSKRDFFHFQDTMTLAINSTRIGGWGSQTLQLKHSLFNNLQDACGFSGGLGRLAKIAVEYQTV